MDRDAGIALVVVDLRREDWRALDHARAARELAARGHPVELAVFARSGLAVAPGATGLEGGEATGLAGWRRRRRALARRLDRGDVRHLHLVGAAARAAAPLRVGRPITFAPPVDDPDRGLAGALWRGRGPVGLELVPWGLPRRRSFSVTRSRAVGWGLEPPAPGAASPGGGRRIGCVTPRGSAAALREMLEAFRAFGALDPGATLIVLAEPERAPLAPWTERLGLEDRVQRRPLGVDPGVALQDLDQLWLHGGPEPDPRLALMAMARGIPVVIDHVTSLAPGIREIGGALMRDGAWPRQFAEAARELVESEDLRAAVSRAGPILVAERHARGAYLDRLAAAFGLA
ncbi:MAG: hypothetical protein R3F20_18310 [Planctomycetota bacterium]